MKPEVKEKLLSKAWVGERLRRVRESHGFGTIKAVQEKIKSQPGPALTGLFRNEDGAAFPGWDTLVVLAAACDMSLSELVAEIEGKPVVQAGVEIVRGKEPLYEMLTTILQAKNDRREQGITVNLEDISAAARIDMERKKHATEDVGDPTHRVRKKQRTG